MIEEIKKEIERLEIEHEIKILYAVESGSRAWGFASKDSDWDVRYVYVHKLDWYLKIDSLKDSQDKILPNDLDLSGWELKKALKLFRKSNPPLLEWLESPIVYCENGSLATKMRDLKRVYFEPKSCMHHYFNMGRNNLVAYLDKEVVRTKKYLYVFRPFLACDWISNQGTMPPVEFDRLIASELKDDAVKKELDYLLERKKSGEELSEEPRNEVLFGFLSGKMDEIHTYLQTFEKGSQPETEILDRLFKETLEEAWE